MKLQSAYLNGFERQRFDAYDVALYPLTLGHIQILAELGCALASPGEKFKDSDVAMIVAACAFPMFTEARAALLDSGYLNEVCMRVADCPKDEARGHNSTVAEFIAYYLAKPRDRARFDPMELRVPWWWSYAEFLQSELHRTEEDAWSTIVCDAFAYYASFACRNGSDQFMTAREVELEDFVAGGGKMADLFAKENG